MNDSRIKSKIFYTLIFICNSNIFLAMIILLEHKYIKFFIIDMILLHMNIILLFSFQKNE